MIVLSTIRAKLLTGLAFMALIVAGMVLYTGSVNRTSATVLSEIIAGQRRLAAVNDARSNVLQASLHAMDAIVSADRGGLDAEKIRSLAAIDKSLRQSLPTAIGPHSPMTSPQLLSHWGVMYSAITTELRVALEKKDRAALTALDEKIDGNSDKIVAALTAYSEILDGMFQKQTIETADHLSSSNLALNIIGGITFLVVALIGLFVQRGLLSPLRQAIEAMRRLAAGEQNVTVDGTERGDEIGDMNRALSIFVDGDKQRRELEAEQGRMVTQTKSVARGVQTNAGQIAGAATEASSAIQQIAQGVHQQVQALVQVGTAVSQSVRAINEINSNAMTARDNAASLQKLSQEGLSRVATLSEVVTRSAEASEQIRDITQVIDAISRKTNLLSLNAQIEAANAGEVGRGFAVVANEVQTLADSVARSSSEIAKSVDQIILDVRSISGSAEAVNEIIGQFQDSALMNANLMMSVSAAVEETEATVTEINASMDQIGQISRSNAASTEELSATMHDLASVADNMRKQVETMV